MEFVAYFVSKLSEHDNEIELFSRRQDVTEEATACGNIARMKIALDWLIYAAARAKKMDEALRELLEPLLSEELDSRGVYDPQDE